MVGTIKTSTQVYRREISGFYLPRLVIPFGDARNLVWEHKPDCQAVSDPLYQELFLYVVLCNAFQLCTETTESTHKYLLGMGCILLSLSSHNDYSSSNSYTL